MKIEEILNTVINKDCLEVMRELPDKCIDLVLTDPPYGINADKGVGGFGSSKTDRHYEDNWDSKRPSKEVFDEIIRISKNAIIFGGQFFADLLPVNGHWIVWDKKGSIVFDNPFGDCELAWTNLPKKSVKKYTIIQQGFVSKEKTRWHPTQKPVELFADIILDYLVDTRIEKDDPLPPKIVLDPFLGSGTTAVAAKQLGRNYIGIEISEKYCKIAQDRLRQDILI